MIRHAFFGCGLRCGKGLAPPVGALAVAVIEAAFFGLLMATIGGAVFSEAGEFATGFATVDLLLVTAWADEEHIATARRETKALPKGGLTIIRHVDSGDNGQPRPKMGKCGLTRLVLRKRSIQGKTPAATTTGVLYFPLE